jgi:hypothetical protein
MNHSNPLPNGSHDPGELAKQIGENLPELIAKADSILADNVDDLEDEGLIPAEALTGATP